MSFSLLTFSRNSDEEPDLELFHDAGEAMDRFTERERELRHADGDRGVVLLIADDEETLRRTHTHYFVDSVAELAKTLTR
jgi:hypothetical protein